MAKNDIKVVSTGVPTRKVQTEAAATAINAGEPVKIKAAGSPYAIPLADADLTLGTDVEFLGIAATDSTHTASADGFIDVYVPVDGVVYEAKAKTAASVDTLSELNALLGDRVTFDLTSSVFTIDTDAGDAVGNAVHLIGGDPARKTVRFLINRGTNSVAGA